MLILTGSKLMAAEVTHDATSAFNYYGRWERGAIATTLNSGALVEFAYSGNSCALEFDVAGLAFFPAVFVQVDNGPIKRTTLAADVATVPLQPEHNATPQGAPPYPAVVSRHHVVRFWVATHSLYLTPASGRQWTTLEGACRFKGVTLPAGEKLEPIPYISDQIEFLGDSITQGLRLLYTGKEGDTDNQIPYANWPQLAADLLAMKPVVTGFGGQGLSRTGTSGAPPATEALPWIRAGVKWTPPVQPKAVVIYMGANDTIPAEDFRGRYAAYLTQVRRAYPTAMIFAVAVHVARCAPYVTPIREVVEATHDTRIAFLDCSTGVIAKEDTCDTTHLNPGGAVRLATRIAGDVARHLTPSP